MPIEQQLDADLAEVAERLRQSPIQVADVTGKLHPMVKKTQEALQAVAKKEKGDSLIWAASSQPHIDVGVGRASIDRITRILEALVRGLESAGFQITGPMIEGHGIAIRFRVREKTSQVPHKSKPGASKYDLLMAPRYDYVPTGVIGIEFGNQFNAWSTHNSVWETKKKPLEDSIPGIPTRLIYEAQAYRNGWAAEAEAACRKAEEEAAASRKQGLVQRRKERDDALFQLADRWQQCKTLRGFIEAVRQVAVEEVGSPEADPQIATWLAWAGRVAHRHDPLTGMRASSPKRRG
jgi:hypothetical protein